MFLPSRFSSYSLLDQLETLSMHNTPPFRNLVKYVDYVPDSEEEEEEEERENEHLPPPKRHLTPTRTQEVIEISSDDNDDTGGKSDISLASIVAAPPSQLHLLSKVTKQASQDTVEMEISPTSSKEVSQLLSIDNQSSSQASISAGDASQSKVFPLRKKQIAKPPNESPSIKSEIIDASSLLPTSRSPGTPYLSRQRKHNQSATPPISEKKESETPKSTGRDRPVGTPTKQKRGRRSKVDPAKARLEEYCKQFFKELSANVFNNLFGEETRLEWSNRLTRTAGRAHYSRHLDGSEESRIELSSKVVDRDDRLRNTLSHEMCHLAAWRFDGNRDGSHGPEWSKWADKVMRQYPNVKITRMHTYELDFPFKWKCIVCGKTYGRWSKSISTDRMVCTCDGELVFVSSNLPTSLMGREKSKFRTANPSPRRKAKPRSCVIDLTCDSDNEVEELALGVDNIDLTR